MSTRRHLNQYLNMVGFAEWLPPLAPGALHDDILCQLLPLLEWQSRDFMRIAIVSDIHGNRTAFEAVLADLLISSPDMVFHGGDLADAGASPLEIVDRIRDLGWPGVAGNTDQMLSNPETLTNFANQSPTMQPFLSILEEMAQVTRDLLGPQRIRWLSDLPLSQTHGNLTLVHASPGDPWRAPAADASDGEFQAVFGKLASTLAVYGHIHRPFIRTVQDFVVANSGSVGLPYDGDPRASYLLLDDNIPRIRRVEYDVEKEIQALTASTLPHTGWLASSLTTANPQVPQR
jgi:putative phosphoesterase